MLGIHFMSKSATVLVFFLLVTVLGITSEYRKLCGEGTKVWNFVGSEDYKFLDLFDQLFVKQYKRKEAKYSIPKEIHFIWIGPKEFPKKSVGNIYSWIEKNDDFLFYFWTDRERELPHPKMVLMDVKKFEWKYLKRQFDDSTNYAEKSDLLRYEILLAKGGIYVDHDVECYKSFSELAESYDFFCGVEPPHKPLGSTSIEVCNNLIGACVSHPILKNTICEVQEKWELYKSAYPGEDTQSITKRVYNRTFSSFDRATKKECLNPKYSNVVFPAGFFNKLEKKYGIYAHHFYDSTWFSSETKFEKSVRKKITKVCKKNNQIMLILMGGFILVFFLILLLFIQIRSLKMGMKGK